jgi:hypothetical protein
MIELASGLEVSLKILEELKKIPQMHLVNVSVKTFINGRECGFTYMMFNGINAFTWCTYEHRNSDSIIINGCEGYKDNAGDLPYATDSKWDYIATFSPGQYKEAAKKLSELILEYAAKEVTK